MYLFALAKYRHANIWRCECRKQYLVTHESTNGSYVSDRTSLVVLSLENGMECVCGKDGFIVPEGIIQWSERNVFCNEQETAGKKIYSKS